VGQDFTAVTLTANGIEFPDKFKRGWLASEEGLSYPSTPFSVEQTGHFS